MTVKTEGFQFDSTNNIILFDSSRWKDYCFFPIVAVMRLKRIKDVDYYLYITLFHKQNAGVITKILLPLVHTKI